MSEIEKKNGEESADSSDHSIIKQKEDLGALLRHARERRGLSRQDLAERIRLRLFYIHALEEEAWDRLPAPVFVKGFIKSYARAVGLDEKEVLELYQSQVPQVLVPPLSGIRNKQTRFRAAYGVTVVLFLVLLSFLIIYFGGNTGLKSRSQINLYKDQSPSHDYTFMPGDKREWRAKKGFIIIVGNAAGIDFELNGVKYEKLGDPNQVIKLNFPEDFERKENEQ